MKKASSGITLVNSTSHQVYNSVDQMKAKWGSSFNTYYTKVKNAVSATIGQVLKYNGKYIEALYYAISNGKSELPKYSIIDLIPLCPPALPFLLIRICPGSRLISSKITIMF